MPTGPLVSLIMPARQPHPEWLRAAVVSALTQRDCQLELVVVDDGSPEPVADLLVGIDDPRLRIIRIEPGGVSHARNAGLAAASGDYLRFIDSDDVLEPGSTARLVALAGAGPGATIAYGATLSCDEQLRPLELMRSDLEGWIAEDCLLYRFDVRCMSLLFPRPVVDAIGEWDTSLRHCQDWDYVLRATEHAPVHGDQEVATFYRRHSAAQTSNVAASLHFETMVVDRYFERHPELAGTRLERLARAQLLRVRAGAGALAGYGLWARVRMLARAFTLDRAGTVAAVARAAIRAGRRAVMSALRAAARRARP
jgi:glycosyltransferase involved in cell wall biosynthesis